MRATGASRHNILHRNVCVDNQLEKIEEIKKDLKQPHTLCGELELLRSLTSEVTKLCDLYDKQIIGMHYQIEVMRMIKPSTR
jgi:hypothetical protein